MPRVKIDYIVSFSSEDPDHPASNLLAWEVSKKKWLCKKGETSCSVVLQLTKAVKISSVHIGAYHSALVEVLVARSEKGNEQYQVLVPSCVFVPPTESRRDSAVERVRSFTSEQLQGEARDQRWDRVRVVCSQPYNKHCKYGLSFIHIDESGDDAASSAPVTQTQSVPASVPPRMLALETYSSDEEDFRPGELFAKHHSQNSTGDTGAQIRQATSQALKNMPESNTKLMKTPISKPSSKRDPVSSSEGRSDRTRDNLLYTQDDVKPHAKIDQIVQRHKDQKDKEVHEKKVKEDKVKAHEKREKDRDKMREKRENEYKAKAQDTKERDRTKSHERRDKEKRDHNDEGCARKRRKSNSPAEETPPKKKIHKDESAPSCSSKNRADEKKRRSQSSAEDHAQEQVEEISEPHTLLQDVVLVLSGYENPQRSTVRNTALALGARVVRDWAPTCTHLICAFPNTPKLRQVRASSGDKVPVVLADWILQCSQRQRRLPWQWFATERKYRRPEEPLPPLVPKQTDTASDNSPSPSINDHFDTDCDTDDEIEKVIQKQKKKVNASLDDVTTASTKDGQVQSMEVDEEPSTDEESAEEAAVPRFGGALPNFFDGHTFVIDEGPDAEQLSRYIKAYGGLVLQLSELDEDTSVEYLVCSAHKTKGSTEHTRGAKRVTPAWVADCHRAGRLVPPD